MKRLLDRIRDLDITDTVSEKTFYEQYGLTPEKATIVTVKNGDRVLRKLIVGDAASTGRHTYVRLDDRAAVYQMAGTFSEDMNLNAEQYRDKEICNAVIDRIKGLTISYKGKTFNLYKKPADVPVAADPKKTKKEDRWFCRELGDVMLDSGRMRPLLSSFAPLRASGFAAEKPEALGRKTATVSLTLDSGNVTLSIYEHKEEKKYAVVSPQSPYVFLLDEWKAKKYFIENMTEFRDGGVSGK